MLAILPLFERDFKNHSTDGQTYAVVFDATQLMLGRPPKTIE